MKKVSPKEKENTIKASIWLPPETHEALKQEAKSKGLTVSSLVRMLLIEHTNKAKQQKDAEN